MTQLNLGLKVSTENENRTLKIATAQPLPEQRIEGDRNSNKFDLYMSQ